MFNPRNATKNGNGEIEHGNGDNLPVLEVYAVSTMDPSQEQGEEGLVNFDEKTEQHENNTNIGGKKDDGLVVIYAVGPTSEEGKDCGKENGDKGEGWEENTLYGKSDETDDKHEEGWVDNQIYAE